MLVFSLIVGYWLQQHPQQSDPFTDNYYPSDDQDSQTSISDNVHQINNLSLQRQAMWSVGLKRKIQYEKDIVLKK